ncbi:glycosyltransferase [Cellulomonas marina]|uniref:Glycosyl transferases group 1 n=1 Tax=Cellulomonas marina TaxID=988821 RepID=A0A1I0V6P1_9CELL|nr:glycosyltransferase [Cellulomonas marina]GIG28372.1 glycosyl transferase [Cellulomonas marina]SFA72001.1 Glycosyl transferases group 1 [Cellulomonas marina]
MKVLAWHVHGSWMTSFVHGSHDYLVPRDAERSRDGGGRATTYAWPDRAREVPIDVPDGTGLAEDRPDVVVLQRPHELELLKRWTGLRAGVDVPAVYVEHNTPAGPAAATRHHLADRSDIPVVHVTAYNALMWDSGAAPTLVVDHGIVDPGYTYTGERERVAVVVNEPVRRWRVAGTDLVVRVAEDLPVEVYGMGMDALAEHLPQHKEHLHEDVRQADMHVAMGGARAYLHPYRWTSLGLSLLEAMTVGLPVLVVASTAAPEAVPAAAGVVSADPAALVAAGRRWLADPTEARERGLAGREHALAHYGLARFHRDWDEVLAAVVEGRVP